MFRIVNRRRNEIIEIEAQVLFSSLEPDGRGGTVRRYALLPLERNKVTFFPLAWTIVHPIDEASPLAGKSLEELERTRGRDPGVAVGDRRDLRADRPRAILVQRRRNRLERAVPIDVPADGRQGTRVDRHQPHQRYRAALRRSRGARLGKNNCHQISATMMGTVTPFAKHTLALVALCATTIAFSFFRPAKTTAQSPASEYVVYVASEAADSISLVRFGPNGGRLDHVVPTGIMPTEIDGPHGLAMSPDHRFYYVSLAHGQPFGSVWKYSTTGDAVVGRVTLGMFPATLHIDAGRGVCVRRQLQPPRRHGAFVVSVVATGRDGGSRPHPDVHDATRLAAEPARHQALLGLHDGRRAGGNRHEHAQSVAPFHS